MPAGEFPTQITEQGKVIVGLVDFIQTLLTSKGVIDKSRRNIELTVLEFLDAEDNIDINPSAMGLNGAVDFFIFWRVLKQIVLIVRTYSAYAENLEACVTAKLEMTTLRQTLAEKQDDRDLLKDSESFVEALGDEASTAANAEAIKQLAQELLETEAKIKQLKQDREKTIETMLGGGKQEEGVSFAWHKMLALYAVYLDALNKVVLNPAARGPDVKTHAFFGARKVSESRVKLSGYLVQLKQACIKLANLIVQNLAEQSESGTLESRYFSPDMFEGKRFASIALMLAGDLSDQTNPDHEHLGIMLIKKYGGGLEGIFADQADASGAASAESTDNVLAASAGASGTASAESTDAAADTEGAEQKSEYDFTRIVERTCQELSKKQGFDVVNGWGHLYDEWSPKMVAGVLSTVACVAYI